jgi:hypothetical protein
VDAVTLDGLLGELRPRLLGRHLGRPRLVGPCALSFEVSGEKAFRLWLDASRASPGVYWLEREAERRLTALHADPPAGRARQALLHVRKHLEGARVRDARRVPGERAVVLETASGRLLLALGPVPSLTLFVSDLLLGGLGEGALLPAVPEDAPEREWSRVSAEAVAAAAGEARAKGASVVRAVLGLCPGLSPRLAREAGETPESFERLRSALRNPRPTLVAPGPPGGWTDADLAPAEAVALWPFAPTAASGVLLHPPAWSEAAALFLEARHRGSQFDQGRRRALTEARRESSRLRTLEAHLLRDRQSLPEAEELRRDAEAILASAAPWPSGRTEVEVLDPYEPTKVRRIAADPGLGGPGNADRIFAKARRIERARLQVEARLASTRTLLERALEREEALAAARGSAELLTVGKAEGPRAQRPAAASTGPRHYLTSRGLSVLVGRGARENHHLTFTVARPDDLWLHARDVPGAHVILKDPEGRAGAEDLREAAEIAAFFSDAGPAASADVHVTRRKHVRPARGGAGRVALGHTETLRVAPRDPEGRLRRR